MGESWERPGSDVALEESPGTAGRAPRIQWLAGHLGLQDACI